MLKTKTSGKEIGYVTRSKEYIAYIEGLPSVKINDMLIGENGEEAMVSSLEEDYVIALILNKTKVKPGMSFYPRANGVQIPLGPFLLGRTINPLGVPLDSKGDLPTGRTPLTIEVVAPGIGVRANITEQLKTGISLVDLLLPIGKGQKELIFGEPRSGKTTFLVDLMNHQKKYNVICIYGALGKSELEVKRFTESLEQSGAFSYSMVIAALASDSAPLIAITPTIAFAVADYFLSQGNDVLIILDDLGTHAKYLREISLLAERVPGRESYPGDIFYQHAHIIERAGNFIMKDGSTHSITLLPVMETNFENLTTLIPTNLISSTDGHLLFSSALHAQGQYPPIEIDRSVTRVGRQTQLQVTEVLSNKIRTLLAEYRELMSFSRFGSEVTYETQVTIRRGQMTMELLKQELFTPIHTETQIILFTLLFTPMLLDKDIDFLARNKKNIIQCIDTDETIQAITKELPTISFEQLVEKVTALRPTIDNVCQ